ncbi:MAG TPA: hypothetical protein VNW99_08480, partial [Cytophagaceae bacterium]|nr:hypothetical protein [Cytophagaceae bacterium]
MKSTKKYSLLRMKKLLIISFALVLISPGFAQNTYNNWVFGTYGGLNFPGPIPTAGPPIKLKSQEACGIISGPTGLIMYSDGLNLWDGTNTSRSTTLLGAESGAQAALIIPFPGSATKYFIFTGSVDPFSGGIGTKNGINYLTVDVSTWTFTAPVNLVSATTASEHLCAVSDGGTGFWIVGHLNTDGVGGGNNNIVSFHFNGTGAMDAGPVTSNAGGISIVKWIGTVKTNNCGNKLAFTYYEGGVELYAFDNSTGGGTSGKVTSLLKSFVVPTAYGVEFSPNDQFLYWTNLSGNALYQFDIVNNGNPAGSGTPYTNAAWKSSNELSEMGQLQLGPDGKIYVSESSNGGQATIYLGSIDSPNSALAAATYNGSKLIMSTTFGHDGMPFRGLPNIYRTLLISGSLAALPGTSTYCTGVDIPLSYTFAGSAASQTWSVTPGTAGVDYTYTSGSSTTPNPTINFITNNTFTVQVQITDNCAKVYNKSMTITTQAAKVPAGTISCGTGTLTLTATGTIPADYPNYTWYDAAAGGNVLGVGSPVTLNDGDFAHAPTSVWVEVSASTSITTSGTNQTIGPA